MFNCFNLYPYLINKLTNSITALSTRVINPQVTAEIATTAMVCLPSVLLSTQMIFLNSAFKPLNQFFLDAFFQFLPLDHLLPKIIWFLCTLCAFCRICSTSLSPFSQDGSFSLLSCCNYAVCIQYMPMWFLRARLPPPLCICVIACDPCGSAAVSSFLPCFCCSYFSNFRHKKKTFFHVAGFL